MESDHVRQCITVLCCFVITVSYSATDPNDLKILIDFKNGLDNPELLKWPDKGDDPCGRPSWPHVFCSGDRVTQIQVANLGLKGPLPQNFNQLTKLYNLGLQRNQFNGKLPTFSGLSELEFAFLNSNEFDTIPLDFFHGLTSLRNLALDYNPLNATTGWSIPPDLSNSLQLTNLSLIKCSLVGNVPDFLGTLPSLQTLKLSFNGLSGEIQSSFGESMVQVLWLNDQDGGMSGPIDVVAKMVSLTQLWLHGNQFTGTIPENIGDLTLLKDLNLNRNQLVGYIPKSLANMELDNLVLNNNLLMGSIPKFKAGNVSYTSNSFCQSEAEVQCAPEVYSLLDFLSGVNYPLKLASQWSGNNPCDWLGLSCNPQSKVSVINLPKQDLSGFLSPSVAKLDSLIEIRLGGNKMSGIVPKNFTGLNSLRLLDLSGNNFEPPLPKFRGIVKVVTEGNPLLVGNRTVSPPSPHASSPPPESSRSPPNTPSPQSPPTIIPPSPGSSQSPPSRRPPSSGGSQSPPSTSPPSPISDGNSNTSRPIPVPSRPKGPKRSKVVIVGGLAGAAVLILLVIPLSVYCSKRRKHTSKASSSVVVHSRDPSDPGDMIKIAISTSTTGYVSTQTAASSETIISCGTENSNVIEAGNTVISVQVLRKVTNNFAPENKLGQGGFGTVYKGKLEDGTNIAVKRMEAGVLSNKASNEFQAEIAVLSKVRHRHLVSLIGYSIEGNEKLLVYEYMSQGALSKHLFEWNSLNLKPLSWTQRLAIALDVARGMEYLHRLARETFIHRDLKSSNILLDDSFRAKVSDFGLVKLAPDGKKSVVTRLAGTFGYLAPEYAVLGKITTKVDVFSYGVVLMELLTGLKAIDEQRSEESQYLAEWFWRIKSCKETLMAAIDPALEANEETFESILTIAELAGHCTTREPNHRPDMGHAVSVLALLLEKWNPINCESDNSGISFRMPLPQMLNVWQEAENNGLSTTNINDSTQSIPARPTGFADSFTSGDGR